MPHRKNAATADKRAATPYPATRPASLDGGTVGVADIDGTASDVEFAAVPLKATKLAQVIRVVLLV